MQKIDNIPDCPALRWAINESKTRAREKMQGLAHHGAENSTGNGGTTLNSVPKTQERICENCHADVYVSATSNSPSPEETVFQPTTGMGQGFGWPEKRYDLHDVTFDLNIYNCQQLPDSPRSG